MTTTRRARPPGQESADALSLQTKKAGLMLFIVTFVWGSGFVVSQFALDAGMTPMQLVAGRFTVAAVVLDLIFFKKCKSIKKAELLAGCFIGIWLFAGMVFQTFGLQHSSPSVNAFVTSTYVIMIPFLYWALFQKKPDRYTVFAGLLTVVGVSLISINGKMEFGLGVVLTVICAVAYAAQVSSIDLLTKRYDPVTLTLGMVNLTAILSIITAAVMAFVFHDLPELNRESVICVVYLGLFATALGFVCQNIGQKYTSAAKASVIFSTESVFGCILSVLVYHEALSLRMLTGCVVIFVAILLSETKFEFLKHSTMLGGLPDGKKR